MAASASFFDSDDPEREEVKPDRPSWDASYLGQVAADAVQEIIPIKPYSLVRLKLGRDRYWVTYHPVDTKLGNVAGVVDELAPLFGLPKMGTNTIKIGKKLYCIYRTGRVFDTLANIPTRGMSSRSRRAVQDIFTFRYIMGLGPNTLSSIFWNRDAQPVSYQNKQISLDLQPISTAMTDAWFVDSMSDSYARLRHPKDHRIVEVIERVDPELVWLANQIQLRISDLN